MNHVRHWEIIDVNHSLHCRQLLEVQEEMVKMVSGVLEETALVPIVLQEVDEIHDNICPRIVIVIETVVQEDRKCEDNHHQLEKIHVHPNRVAVAHQGIYKFIHAIPFFVLLNGDFIDFNQSIICRKSMFWTNFFLHYIYLLHWIGC